MDQGIVLVVGGAGYVGSVLVAELVQRGYAVRVLDRMWFGESGLAPIRDKVQIVAADMRTVPLSVFEGVCAVINVGGLSNDPTAEFNPSANMEINARASVRLAERCVERGIRRYILASSCSIYDRGVTHPGHDAIRGEQASVAPTAAYSVSKLEAERGVLGLASASFCPTAIRKGTVYGHSPRMRYDLVVNTFVRDALRSGVITLHAGGEMWRPLVAVRDAARAYIACLHAREEDLRGQVFNLAFANYRVSQVAQRVQGVLGTMGVPCDIRIDRSPRVVRSYRVATGKITSVLGIRPSISVEEAAQEMVTRIREGAAADFDNPRYYNIDWLTHLQETARRQGQPGPLDQLE